MLAGNRRLFIAHGHWEMSPSFHWIAIGKIVLMIFLLNELMSNFERQSNGAVEMLYQRIILQFLILIYLVWARDRMARTFDFQP